MSDDEGGYGDYEASDDENEYPEEEEEYSHGKTRGARGDASDAIVDGLYAQALRNPHIFAILSQSPSEWTDVSVKTLLRPRSMAKGVTNATVDVRNNRGAMTSIVAESGAHGSPRLNAHGVLALSLYKIDISATPVNGANLELYPPDAVRAAIQHVDAANTYEDLVEAATKRWEAEALVSTRYERSGVQALPVETGMVDGEVESTTVFSPHMVGKALVEIDGEDPVVMTVGGTDISRNPPIEGGTITYLDTLPFLSNAAAGNEEHYGAPLLRGDTPDGLLGDSPIAMRFSLRNDAISGEDLEPAAFAPHLPLMSGAMRPDRRCLSLGGGLQVYSRYLGQPKVMIRGAVKALNGSIIDFCSTCHYSYSDDVPEFLAGIRHTENLKVLPDRWVCHYATVKDVDRGDDDNYNVQNRIHYYPDMLKQLLGLSRKDDVKLRKNRGKYIFTVYKDGFATDDLHAVILHLIPEVRAVDIVSRSAVSAANVEEDDEPTGFM
jgi:rubredoxin